MTTQGPPYSVDEWAPIFTRYFTKDEQLLAPNYAISAFGHCKLCDTRVVGKVVDHLRRHKRELTVWRARRTAERARAAKQTLGLVQQEKGALRVVQPPKVTARAQGFPEPYLAESGNFKPGFDAKAKSHLVAAARGGAHPDALASFTKDEALRLLELRNWMKYLGEDA